MIDQQSGIEAVVRPYNEGGHSEPYYEYLAPRRSPLYTAISNERYIQAVTNERFAMTVNIPKGFDFKKYTHIQIIYEIDGGTDSNRGLELWEHIAKPDEDQPVSGESDYVEEIIDGKYREVGFSFREFDIVEECEPAQEQEETTALDRGQIRMRVQLGRSKESRKRRGNYEMALPQQQTSKRIAIDQGKSHGVQRVDLGESGAIDWDDEWWKDATWVPARGKAGKETVFTFYYASRMILELKKVIPDSPVLLVGTTRRPSVTGRSTGGVAAAPFSSTGAVASTPTDDMDDEEAKPAMLSEPKTALAKTKLAAIDGRSSASGNKVDRRISIESDDELMIISETTKPPVRIKREVKADSSVSSGERPRRKMKTEHEDDADVQGRGTIPLSARGNTASSGQSEKAKKKARLLRELRKIEIEEQLMELEDEG